MRVGIDARLLAYQQGGISQYIRCLVEALAQIDGEDDFTLFQHRKNVIPLVRQDNFRRRTLLTPSHHPLEQWTLPLEIALSGVEVLHSPDFILPLRRRCPAVITVHDLAFLRFPGLLTPESQRYYEQVGAAVESAEGIIAVSEATRQDMVQLLGLSPERVDVVHHAPEPIFRPLEDEEKVRAFCRQRGLPDSFMLWVSTLEPRKNLEALLRALALTRGKLPAERMMLVAVGARGWLFQPVLELVEELGLRDQVVFFGAASREELLYLYNAAWLFVFPSLYEGFGLPPLEAMACGTPVLSSKAPALPEVLGEAPLYFDPRDPQSLAEGLQRLSEDGALREELRHRGLERAAQFSWEETARRTLAVYQRVHRA